MTENPWYIVKLHKFIEETKARIKEEIRLTKEVSASQFPNKMKHNNLTIRQVLRQLEDMAVITIKQRNIIWKDYWSMNLALRKVKRKVK